MPELDSIESLALFSGRPAFQEKLHVGRPNIGDRDRLIKRVNDILERRWLTNNGPYVQEFERRLCEITGTRHCIPVCNATVALELVVRALELRGEVILPSFTFIATAHALEWQRITPVFCDVDPATHNIDPRSVEALITPRTTGILGVHIWGRPCAVEELEAVAARHNLKLLFDAAHAFACSSGGRAIGGFGAAEVFSFHATKFVNSGEGGAIATNDDELAARIRLMKNFGFAGFDNVVYIGTNGKMNEMSAAMGITSVESLDAFIDVNRRNHARYASGLRSLDGLDLVMPAPGAVSNYQYVVMEIDEAQAGLTRDELQAVLWAENVLARRYFYPGCHRMEPYRSAVPEAGSRLPHTERLVGRVLSVPTGTAVELHDIDTICSILRTALGNPGEVRARLRQAGTGATVRA